MLGHLYSEVVSVNRLIVMNMHRAIADVIDRQTDRQTDRCIYLTKIYIITSYNLEIFST